MDTNAIWKTYIELGEKAYRHGQYDIAESMLRAAIKEGPKLRKEPIPLAPVLENLAEIFCQQKRYIKSERQYKRTLELYMREGKEDNPNVCRILYKVAHLHLIQKKLSLAELWYERALEAGKRCKDLDPQQHAQWILKLVKLWHEFGLHDMAFKAYQEVLMLRLDMNPTTGK
ncbi:MAG TPA: tetratricopeptide repeat protein [Candidatus Obscuribacterales bacterium]